MESLGQGIVKRDDSETAFFIPDSSPLFKYSSSSSSSSNTTNPWTAGYAQQTDGYDQTLHLTSSNYSIIEFNITSTSLTLLVPQIEGCSATVSINGTTPVPACATNSSSSSEVPWSVVDLDYATHSIKYDSGLIPSSSSSSSGEGGQVIFWGVQGTRPGGGVGTNVTVDDTFFRPSSSSSSSSSSSTATEKAEVSITYSPSWTHLSETSTTSSILSEIGQLGGDFNGTLSVSQEAGDWVTFWGAGEAIYVYGTVGPDYGSARVELDGAVVVEGMNLTSPWTMQYQLLYFQTNLDPSVATNLTMTNLGGSGGEKMSLDFVILTARDDVLDYLSTPSSSKPFTSTLGGKLILCMLLPLLVVLLFSAFAWWIVRRRRNARRSRSPPDAWAAAGISSWVPWTPGKEKRQKTRGGSSRPWRHSHDSSSTSINNTTGGKEKRKYWLFPGTTSSSSTGGRGSPTDWTDGEGEDVFVSYDEAKLQRMSGKWSSSSGSGTGGAGRSPVSVSGRGGRFTPGLAAAGWGLGTVEEDERDEGSVSMRSGRSRSSSRSGRSGGNGDRERERGDDRDIMSVLDRTYATPTISSRRHTALPAYTPSNDAQTNYTYSTPPNSHHTTPQALNRSLPASSPSSATGTGTGAAGSPESQFMSAEEEKAAQLRVMRDVAGGQGYSPPRLDLALPGSGPGPSTPLPPPPISSLPHPTQPLPRPAHAHHAHQASRSSATTIGASDIISIFGAPAGSERRMSMMTDHTGHSQFYSRPGSVVGDVPPLPTSSTWPGWIFGSVAPVPGGLGGGGAVRPRIDTDLEKNPYGLPHMSHGRDASGGLSAMGTSSHMGLMGLMPSGYESATLSGLSGTSNPWPRTLNHQTSQMPLLPPSSSNTSPSSPPTSYSSPQSHARPSTAPSHTLPPVTSVTTPNSAEHQRSQSTFSHMTERSGARPDSEVIPFESFISSLNAAAAAAGAREEEGKRSV
ncbi:hypothetical protein L202_03177 [Cryptococcus amylolentus CBS 6039]|uniref:Uncharacterized protein n=1 Tax=Cryptococcus amylolentus CBS 6039 TaxID=1295533 RepID=A0A1E3HXM9_9TREE|nr:hypothetical protein L202_03177 [Cryptococcus amylolentus CBS 6039]ODN81082.1 hypothetical protein L202_03177 [Cryptococcus amylolentus CBS 6039]